jgi:Flp pilus assembly protein TadB
MKSEKKDQMTNEQQYKATVGRNRKISRVNIFILGAGLILTLLDQIVIGTVLIYMGIAIFLFTLITNILGWLKVRK